MDYVGVPVLAGGFACISPCEVTLHCQLIDQARLGNALGVQELREEPQARLHCDKGRRRKFAMRDLVQKEAAHQRAQPGLEAEEVQICVASALPVAEAGVLFAVEIVEKDDVAFRHRRHLRPIDDREAMDIAEQLHFRRSILGGDDLASPDPLTGLALPPASIIRAIPGSVTLQYCIIVPVRFARPLVI